MTQNRTFKALIRDRMAATGLTYTAARALLLDEEAERARAAEAEHRTVVSRFMKDGALTSFPAKRKARAHMLLHLVTYFEPGRTYTEPQINDILRALWPDFAYLRRELVDYGYLCRDNSGAYWLASTAPDRWDTVLHAEAPEWEALWLPGYLAGHTES